MSSTREKVVVAMSGGVDSSVAACILKERGYDVIGLFMRIGVEEVAPDSSVRAAGFSPRGPAEVSDRPPSFPPCQGGMEEGRCSPLAKDSISSTAHSSRGESTTDKAEHRCETPRGLKPAAHSHQGCCSASDAADARLVAGMLDIPFYVLDFETEFDQLINYFVDEYAHGRTPNPCIVCNDKLKFGRIAEYADAVGAGYVATGHHARTQQRNGHNVLMRGRDANKDQSYVLFGLSRNILDRVLFPVGELTKEEVRATATRLGLPNRDKPESMEVCFVPDQDYSRLMRERRPEAFVEGEVIDTSGKVIGRHTGLCQYTIGQRRGLGIAAGKPIYVTKLDVATNTITVGEADELLSASLRADRVNYLVDRPTEPFRATVQIRYLHTAALATVEPIDADKVRVIFDKPQRAITPGQGVVFYDGDVVIGGGWISGAG